jgi:YVTN family beta-propeller protein
MTPKHKRTPIGATQIPRLGATTRCPWHGRLVLAALLLMPALTLAEEATFYTGSPYKNNQYITRILSIPDATTLAVSVSGETQAGYDFLEILDSTGNPYDPAKKFSGKIDEWFTLNGEAIQVHFTSDSSVTRKGVTVTINDKPMLRAVSKNVFKDESVAFSATDFSNHFLSPTDSLKQIQVTTLPTQGTLSLGTSEVTVNQEILVSDLEQLTYTPNVGYFGDDSFQFNGSDGTHYAESEAVVNLKVWERKTTFSTANPYENNQDILDILSIPDATALLVRVSGETQTNYDFVEILDSTGHPYEPANKFSGTINEVFAVNGETIRVHFTSNGWTSKSGVTVTISDKPMLRTVSKQTLEDKSLGFAATDFSKHFQSPTGDSLKQIQVTTLPTQGTLSIGTSKVVVNQEILVSDIKQLTYTPNAGYFGEDSFQVNGTDGTHYADSSAAVNLKVWEVGKTTFSTANPYENNQDILEILSIPDATVLVVQVSGETQANYDFVEILDSSGHPYEPANKFSGTIDELFAVNGESIQVRFTSNSYGTRSGVTVTISSEKPMLRRTVSKQTLEDNSLAFSVLDFSNHFQSPTGDSLKQIQVTALPAHGTLSVDTSEVAVNQEILVSDLEQLTYTPNAGYFGEDSFQFNGSDGTHYADSEATVNLKVRERKTTFSTANPYQNNQDILDILSIRDATALVVRVSGETQAYFDFVEILDITGNPYDPAKKWSGPIDELFTVNGEGIRVHFTSNSRTTQSGVTVTISEKPMLRTVSKQTLENKSLAFSVLDFSNHFQSPTGDDSLKQIQVTALPAHGTLSVGTREVAVNQEIMASELEQLTYTPNAGYLGDDSFQFNGSDGTHYADSEAAVNLKVFEEGKTTFSTANPYQNNQDIFDILSIRNATALVVRVSGETETDSDFVEILDSTGNPYEPAKKWSGTIDERFTVNGEAIRVHFTSNGWETQSGVTVTVSNANTPATRVRVNETYSFTPTVSGEGSSLTFAITNRPTWASFDTSTGTLTGTPVTRDIGTTNDISITVFEGLATTTLATFDLTVIENTPPTLSGSPATQAQVGWTYNFTPTAHDDNGDALTFSITNKPDWVDFDPSTGTLSGKPTFEGTTNNLEISVSDGLATTTLAAFDLTVVNRTPPSVSTTEVGRFPTAVAVNPATNQIYVVNFSSNNVTVIDGDTNQTTTVAVGNYPRAVAINPQTNQIYVANYLGNSVTVIDGDTNQTTTVHVRRHPTALAINPQTNQIYVANFESNNVTVIDGDTNQTTTVAVGNWPSALAINPQTNQIYVANSSSDNVTVIDGDTNQTTTVAVGESPRALAINPQTNQIYVANSSSDNVTVIDGDTNQTTVAVGQEPTALTINPQTNQIYVANKKSDNVTVINGDTNQTTTVAVGEEPSVLAINPRTGQIYVANKYSNNVTVIDCDTNHTTTVAVGNQPDALGINPQTNQIYVANDFSDNVTVIDGDTNQTTTVAVGDSPSAIAINPQTNQIYVANKYSDNVTVIDGETNQTTTVAVGNSPRALAINPRTNQIYVANFSSNNVTVIDGDTNQTTTVAVGSLPRALAINPQTNQIYVANYSSDNVTVIDGDTNQTTTVTVGNSPRAVAINPQTNQIYVANYSSDNVTVIDGDTNQTTTVVVGDSPRALAINPQTNQIYVLYDTDSNTVTVIDGGNTRLKTTVMVGNSPLALAVSPDTNQIYVTNNLNGTVTIIDGETLRTETVAVGKGPTALAVNPETNQIYVANHESDTVTVIMPLEKQPNPLAVEFAALPDDTAALSTPTFSFQATTSGSLPVTQIYYQVDSWTGRWLKAFPAGSSATGASQPLHPGMHILYAFATDASLNNLTGANSPMIGRLNAYRFKIVSSPIVLDNRGDSSLTAIDEDIAPTKNQGTLLSELIKSGANGNPITDGDIEAKEGIAVIAVDNTHGTWEYTLDNGNTWTAFESPSITQARLLAANSDTRVRFLPNLNFNGTIDQAITFHAWDQTGNNGGTANITTSDPQAFSTTTETASLTVNDTPEQFTGLSLETSAATLLQSDTVSIVGKLSVFPETGEDLSNHEIVLTITAPDGQTQVTQTTTTNTNTGQFEFKDLLLPDLFNPMQEGAFGFQATFAATRYLAESESAPQAVLVGASAGYAILVQGKIANEEGLAAHNKTIHRIYSKLKERGFEDGNIKYFNYNTAQEGVDGLPLKSDIAAAFTELKARLKSNPAPFYVIMIDHGGSDGSFHIYNGNNDAFDDVIKPAELDGWMANLEEGLSPNALAKPRLVILGYCYSGSFIPEVSGEGRIIVSSATASEESYKGPEEPDGIRSGEYFMEEFFGRLGRGDNVKAAFEWATERTELLTRRGDGSTNSSNRFNDNAAQHPLLDDNGDGRGSNSLATDGDGLQAAKVLLGVGLNYDTNAAGNPAEILTVSDTLYLKANEEAATLTANVNDANRVSSALVDIRPPSVQLSSTGTEQSGQLEIPDLERAFLGCDGQTNRCATFFDQFADSGKYEAFYFVRDTQTQEISPIKRSVIYKDKAGNTPPNAFELVLPAHESEQKTVVLFNWETTLDPDTQAVTYNLILSEQEDFGAVVYKQEELTNAMTFLDETAVMTDGSLGLKDKTTYYWFVEAVDPYGARTASSSVFSFSTNNTNKPPSHINLSVENHTDSQQVSNVQIDYYRADTQVTPDAHVQDQGRALTQIESGLYTVNVTAEGYNPQQFQVDTRTGSINTTVALTPTNPILNYGQLQFAIDSAPVGEDKGAVNLLVKRVGGHDGQVSVDYTTANETATAGIDYTAQSGTLTWGNYDDGAKPINLPITDDSDYEGDETFTVMLSNPTGGATLGAISQLSVTLVENDQPKPGVLQFSASTVTANEGDSTLNLTVTRTEGRDGTVTVQYLANGATVGSDYIGESGTLTWASGDDLPKSLNLQLIEDTEVEATETLQLTLLSPTGGATLGNLAQATLSITDNDVPQQPGTLQFTEPTVTAGEGDGELSLTVTRTGGADGQVTVQYLAMPESTATADSDYTGASGTLTWPAGETTAQVIKITLTDDHEVEQTETVKFTLNNTTGGATLGSPAQATLSITDNDVAATPGTLQFAEPTSTAGEGDGELGLTVTRLGGSDGEITVQYLATGGSTATANSDYTGGSGTLTWPSGDSTPKPLPITLIDDSAHEPTEMIQFTLNNLTGGATLGSPDQATLSIIDNDTAPPVLKPGVLQFAEATYTANESDGQINLSVIRSGGSDGQVTVNYTATDSSTATADSDYTGTQGTLTWATGDMTAKSLTLNLINDTQVEGPEIILFSLSNPSGGATLGNVAHTTVTLADNEVSTPVTPPEVTPPEVTTPEPGAPTTQPGILQFAAATYTADESDGELTNITVTRTGGSDGSVTVPYFITNESTATEGNDYTSASKLTWDDGDTKPKSLPLTIIDDNEDENDETVKLTLGNPTSGATLGNQTTTTLSITDNDTAAPVSPAGVLQFSAPTYLVKETEGELDNIRVTRSGGSSGSVSVEYFATTEGSATVGRDYTGASGTLTWADGDSEPKPLTLTLKDDDELEPGETVHLKLFEVTGEAKLGSPAEAQLVIVDNEGEPLATLGQGLAIGCPNEECSVTTQFRGGSTKPSGPDYQATLSIPASQRVLVRGEMDIEAAHVGQKADLLVVIYSLPLEESQTDQFLMVDPEQKLQEWAFMKDGNINIAALVAAYKEVTLTENQPVALYQGVLSTQKAHLWIYFGYRLQDGQIVFNGEQPIQVRIGLDNQLPRLGQGAAVFCPNNECPPLTTAFSGGASVTEQDYQSTLTLSPTQLVKILGQIDVDAAHVDQKAEILVVAGLTPTGEESTSELFFMLDNQKLPQLWDGDPEKLVAAVKEITLAASVPVEIYQGGLVEGQIRIYFGYRLENGMVVFNGEQVIDLQIKKEP